MTNKEREDVREALEHLRHVKTARQRFKLGEYAVTNQITRARQSLLAALSAQTGEPVAWRRRRKGTIGDGGWIMCPLKPERDREFELQPLYASRLPATGHRETIG